MVYIAAWQDFQDAAEALYERSPNKTRYCVKWRAVEGKLVLKITDGASCLKFKTYSSLYLNRFEALTLSLMQKMQNRQMPEPPIPAQPERAGTPVIGVEGGATSAAGLSASGPAGAGVKKKKPKKKK